MRWISTFAASKSTPFRHEQSDVIAASVSIAANKRAPPGDAYSAQSTRVARAVETLLVAQYDFCRRLHAGHLRHDAITIFWIGTHFLLLAVGQRTLFEQYRIPDADLADIM